MNWYKDFETMSIIETHTPESDLAEVLDKRYPILRNLFMGNAPYVKEADYGCDAITKRLASLPDDEWRHLIGAMSLKSSDNESGNPIVEVELITSTDSPSVPGSNCPQ